MSDLPNVREKLALVQDWLGDQDEQLSFGLRSTNDAITLYDAMCGEHNHLGEMADEWPEVERIKLLGYDPMEASMQAEQRKVQTRAATVAFLNKQLGGQYTSTLVPAKSCWHYGKVELRELMDFIYGGPPRSKRERL